MRALVPPDTPYMACTATATRSVHKEVVSILEMEGCIQVSMSPDRHNIYYEVRPCTDIDSDFSELVSSLRENLTSTPRVIVYCRSLDMCANLYAHFHYELVNNSYHPPNAPHVNDNRNVPCQHSTVQQGYHLAEDGKLDVPENRLLFIRETTLRVVYHAPLLKNMRLSQRSYSLLKNLQSYQLLGKFEWSISYLEIAVCFIVGCYHGP